MKQMEFYYANMHVGVQELLNISRFTDSNWERESIGYWFLETRTAGEVQIIHYIDS